MARAKQLTPRKYTPRGMLIARFGPQYVLAEILGVAQQTVSRKLRGDVKITLADLEKLAHRLKVPIGAFFTADEQACEWECPGCHVKLWHTYAAAIEVGEPMCSKCQRFMEMKDPR